MREFDKLNELHLPELDSDGYIYFLFYKGVLVYIGKSESLYGRIAVHRETKIFDKVLYESCPIEKLKTVERELIKHYKPILNGEYGNKPDKKVCVIGDSIFIHPKKQSFKLSDGRIYDKQNAVIGYIDADYVCWHGSKEWHRYCFSEDSIQDFLLPTKTNSGSFLGYNYYFDENKHEFVAVKKEPKLYDKYEFRFGKYKGKTVSQVKLFNPNYIKWFEEKVPVSDW